MSVSERLSELATSIRGILEDKREAYVVNLAKHQFRAELVKFRGLYRRHDEEKLRRLNLLKIELDTATKKRDIEKLLIKLSKILEMDYPN